MERVVYKISGKGEEMLWELMEKGSTEGLLKG